ncbi:alginate export family protein [Flavobacterium sp.]|uniref:alginate export family protein n=1 Tax=Flavobacterium sp. TaxID=239 RepID=UPI0026334DBF|nr:alginate export family protein [Flavobacterium sp.]
MKSLWILVLTSALTATVSAQTFNFQSLRYNENYSFLRDSASNPYRKLKFAALNDSKSSWMSFGGELRYQYQKFENEDWGDAPHDENGFILTRLLFYADTHLGNRFRIFTQIKSNALQSREMPAKRIEVNALDFHQFFFDYNFNLNNTNITFRAGRQEIRYGSQRLISVREGPNNRLSFDGARILSTFKNGQIDAFYLYSVIDFPDIFDDRINQDNALFGIYTTWKNVPLFKNADLYFLGVRNKNANFNEVSGNENRYSVGGRLWQNKSPFRYDFEALFQFGSFSGTNIAAYTASLDASYQFEKLWKKPLIGLKTEVISGDRSPDDNTLNTFNPMYPRGAYFGLAALVGPSNLIDFHPYMQTNLTDNLIWGIDYDVFWRYSTRDGIYGPNGRLIYPDANSDEKFIGSQLGTDLEYQFSDFTTLVLEGTWFQTGNYLQDVSTGKDIWFTAFTLQFKF